MTEILTEGFNIKDKYTVISCLHSGETGGVYQVNDSRGIKRAIKEIIPHSSISPEVNSLFSSRLDRLKRLNHANLIKVEDFFTYNDRYYIVMNFLTGKTLKDVYEEKYGTEPCDVKFILNYMVKVCGVIKYLHSFKPEPFIFTSLTPSNILITANGQVKLFNYGLTSLLLNSNKGTSGFFAPEQCSNGIINTKTDIFSIGAIIYYMLTGNNPEYKSFDIREVNSDVPEYLSQLIFSCLCDNPDERPDIESVAEVFIKSYIASTLPVKPGIQKNIVKKEKDKPEPEEIIVESKKDVILNLPEPVEIADEPKKDVREQDVRKSSLLSRSLIEAIKKKQKLEEDDSVIHLPKKAVKHWPIERNEDKDIDRTGSIFPELIIEMEEDAVLPQGDKKVTPGEMPVEELPVEEPPVEKPPVEEPPVEEPPVEESPVEEPPVEMTAEEKIKVQEPEISVKSESKSEKISPPVSKEIKIKAKIGSDFRRIKDSSAISAFLKAKSKEEPSGSGKEEIAKITGTDLLDFSSVAPYKNENISPLFPLYEEIDVLNKRYEISEILHRNPFGAIYLVQDYDEEQEEMAEKIVKEIQYQDPDGDINRVRELADKFMKRAALLKSLDHLNLVKILDYFYIISEKDVSVRLFIVTEYVEGLTFDEVLETYKTSGSHMSAITLFGLILKVCQTLTFLHENSSGPIFAGEIRVSNLILASGGEVKLVDYGLAGIFSSLRDEVNPVRGNIGYSAPERIKNGNITAKTDMFSLGTTMYYMLTSWNLSEAPYEFPPLRKLNPFLSPAVEKFISLCISFKPDDRPSPSQLQRIIENTDFFEINKESVKKKVIEEAEEEKDETSVPATKVVEEQVKRALGDFKKENPVLNNRIFQIIMALLLIAIIFFTAKFAVSLFPGKEKDPVIIYSITGTNKITAVSIKNPSSISDTYINKNIVASAYSDKTNYIYSISSSDEKLIESKVGNKNIIRETPLGREPSSITLSSDKKTAYITNTRANNVSVIDLDSFKQLVPPILVGTGPVKSFLSNDGNILCVINKYERTVSLINIKNNAIIDTITVEQDAKNLVFNPDNSKLYIVHKAIDRLIIINLKNKSDVLKINVPSPTDIALEPLSGDLYVTSEKSGELVILNSLSNSIRLRVSLDFYPVKMVKSPVEKKLFITGQEKSGKGYIIAAFDINTGKANTLLTIQGEPLFLLPLYFNLH